MKSKLVFAATLLVASTPVFAQKKPLANDSYKTFEMLRAYDISPDGGFCWYNYGTDRANKYVLFSLKGNKASRFSLAGSIGFSSDSRKFVFQESTDSVCILNLASGKKTVLGQTRMEGPIVRGAKDDILILNGSRGAKILYLNKGRTIPIGQARALQANPQGTMLTFVRDSSLYVLDLAGSDQPVVLGQGMFSPVVFDGRNNSLAYVRKTGSHTALYVYQNGQRSARLLASDESKSLGHYSLSEEIVGFSKNGKRVYFRLQANETPFSKQQDVITSNVVVWNYKDPVTQQAQLELGQDQDLMRLAVVDITGLEKVVQIENGQRRVWSYLNADALPDKYIITSNFSRRYIEGLAKEYYYHQEIKPDFDLLRVVDGRLEKLDLGRLNEIKMATTALSPSENYVTWTDSGTVRSYEIEAKKIRQYSNVPNIAFWGVGERFFLSDDGLDLWKIDLLEKSQPVCLTGGYGAKHHISFQVVAPPSAAPYLISEKEKLVLKAQDLENYETGFWTVSADKPGNPIKKVMGQGMVNSSWPFKVLLKAQRSDVYLVTREMAASAPNLFFTQDLTSYRQITHINPEREYNWLTAELIDFPLADGKMNKAILYKPENFDPNKKYPVIFHYYQKKSDELFWFKKPAVSGGDLNIPWYVSNDYIVCVPDIINDQPGRIAYKAVDVLESAAKFLSKYPWINSEKMGLQGHSFGGYETQWIIAGSNRFAAAQSSAGASNAFSEVGALRFGGHAMYQYWENGQVKMGIGVLPWSHTQAYIDHSPILKVDKITTPLLLQNNKGDGELYTQGIEMFNALRRLKKPVWLLQYDNEGHVLGSEDVMLDFTIRQEQFFDHYLKDKPAPKWLTGGIPYQYKGIKSGLELDTSGRQP